ncbi:lipopolysaccharide assembly protein LapB [Marinimicrobium alkaliphilum]|uniref:lipopolysaccharide assembly protein LapB n=1 Tax=Marinimicrobium alkaliphilum TaxID=2202654 RepID=UPI000DBA0993|nr:lipopolysaccharide assembly protein LapB [Marinimicrobium alkaliphilum]
MDGLGLLVLLIATLAAGLFLGWRARERFRRGFQPFASSYFQGLNYLLNEQVDASVDAFIDSLEVSPETLDTHLALGNLLRRKGEVAKAIKIHQNLLSRPSLGLEHMHQAQLELARDFIKAGLLDRAEGLLHELTESSAEYRADALEHLIEIYQDEREWDKAVKAAEQLLGRRQNKNYQWLSVAAGHFCCEMAQAYRDNNDILNARRLLKQALQYDRSSVRALMDWAALELQQQEYREARRLLQRVPSQDPDTIPELLPLLRELYWHQGDQIGLFRYLSELQEQHPSASLVIELADGLQQREGEMAAQAYITEQLRRRPSLKVLARLVESHLQFSEGRARENLLLLKSLLDQVLAAKPGYCCSQCGFTGNQLHWLCPSCKSWGTIKAIRGVEGE